MESDWLIGPIGGTLLNLPAPFVREGSARDNLQPNLPSARFLSSNSQRLPGGLRDDGIRLSAMQAFQ